MTDPGALSPAKRALLEQLLRRRRETAAPTTTIPRRAATGPAPLSFTQQRMWFLQRWDPSAPTFNAARAVRLRGPLDRAALSRALQTLLERHDSLRTVFSGEHEPVQTVLESYALELPVIELADAEQLPALLRELAREPFDLSSRPHAARRADRTGAPGHVLLLRIHHIAADAHSDGVIFAELSELYAAYREQRSPSLPDVPIRYADFTVWQQARLTGALPGAAHQLLATGTRRRAAAAGAPHRPATACDPAPRRRPPPPVA